MFTLLFVLVVGIFIGWNFPQPSYAKNAQDFIVVKIKSFFNKLSGE